MKTAVEKLFELIDEIPFYSPEASDLYLGIMKLKEQAKEMEKEQHGKTWDTALDKYEVRAGNYMRAYEDFDEYYNETFKSE
jgi:hypothetical protein